MVYIFYESRTHRSRPEYLCYRGEIYVYLEPSLFTDLLFFLFSLTIVQSASEIRATEGLRKRLSTDVFGAK